uniref:Uncharacterized protein n=1 Tax=Arundo donax TaxID=35708 RepID=A0A0A8ZMA0_ARUDO
MFAPLPIFAPTLHIKQGQWCKHKGQLCKHLGNSRGNDAKLKK